MNKEIFVVKHPDLPSSYEFDSKEQAERCIKVFIDSYKSLFTLQK